MNILNGSSQAGKLAPAPSTNGTSKRPAPFAGFFTVPNAVIRTHGPTIGLHGIAVYAALAMHANRAGECWPSFATLATLTNCSRRTIIRVIRELANLGLVEIRRNANRPNTYYLPLTAECPTVTPECPTVTRGVTNSHPGGDCESPKQHPVTKPKNKTQEHGRVRAPRSSVVQENEASRKRFYEQFWPKYPKHEDEKGALAAWMKLNPDETLTATIVEAIVAQVAKKKTNEWKNPRYIPFAKKWLTTKRWNDDCSSKSRPGSEYNPDQANCYD
jgi:hypothetical protein